MTQLHDLLLAKPFGDRLLEVLLFGTFSLHLLFVLLMLGTAMIAVFFFIHSLLTGYRFELRWDKRVLRIHLAVKSLAVVLGVGPLLLVQVLWGVPFLTAAALLGPYWIALIALLVLAFLCLDSLGHKVHVHPLWHLVLGILGLTALLAAPAVFTAVLTAMEHPDRWAALADRGLATDPQLLTHWLARYAHILGAAALFGGVFHYFFSTKGAEERHYHLSHWMVVAVLFQIFSGMGLLLTVRERLTLPIAAMVLLGAATALLLVGLAFYRNPGAASGRMKALLVLLPVILVSMLLARQELQHRAVAPLQTELDARAAALRGELEPFQATAAEAYAAHLAEVYADGKTIYRNACAFCHGEDGSGAGPDAGALIIPPERLAGVRAEREYLYQLIAHGVPGSAMPYFTIYDRPKLESLLDYLDARFAMLDFPQNQLQEPSPAALQTWRDTCATCHGEDGKVSGFGAQLLPPPPDLTRYAPTPEWASAVITRGYPGTAMVPFSQLPEDLRRGLVSQVIDLPGR